MTITREQREAWAANTAGSPFNRWLDAQIRDGEGRLDMERLYELSLKYGFDGRVDCSHLNSGQQRMNIGNRLRRLVPESVYGPASVEPRPEAQARAELPPERPLLPTSPRRDAVRQASVGELLVLYGEIMDELRDRGVVRTGNSPVGDYAELLFARAFGWTLEANSASGHDATDGQGLRYQIKGRRLGSATASRQLSAIRRLDAGTFDFLGAVLLDSTFKVVRAILIPHDVVAARARRVEHTNSWTFILDDRVWVAPGVRDVTAEIAVAASRV